MLKSWLVYPKSWDLMDLGALFPVPTFPPPPLGYKGQWQAITEPTDRALFESTASGAQMQKPTQISPICPKCSFTLSAQSHNSSLHQQPGETICETILLYAQCWISLCNSGSCTTKNKFSSHLTSLNMYGLEMLGWFLLAQFC